MSLFWVQSYFCTHPNTNNLAGSQCDPPISAEKTGGQRSLFSFFFFFFKIYLFILFLAALGLRCCVRVFSSCGEQGLIFIVVHGPLITVASLVEHRL